MPTPPSLVGLIAGKILDAELGALIWLLVEHEVPLVVGVPARRIGAGKELASAILGSVRPDAPRPSDLGAPLDRGTAWALVHGHRSSLVVESPSLEALRETLLGPPIRLSPDELTFLGCVLILGSGAQPHGEAGDGRRDGSGGGAGSAAVAKGAGALRVVAAHYVRPLARDAQGHPQVLPPAVLATWDARLGRYEQFAWGVLPEIAARLGQRAGDLEADLHHRRDDLGGLASAGVTGLPEVRRLVAGYRAAYGEHPHRD